MLPAIITYLSDNDLLIPRGVAAALPCEQSCRDNSADEVIGYIPPQGLVISRPGNYSLANDIKWEGKSGSVAIWITSSDVTLDGKGFAIYGDCKCVKDNFGIAVSVKNRKHHCDPCEVLENVTIKNIRLSNIGVYAIIVEDATSICLEKLTLTNNGGVSSIINSVLSSLLGDLSHTSGSIYVKDSRQVSIKKVNIADNLTPEVSAPIFLSNVVQYRVEDVNIDDCRSRDSADFGILSHGCTEQTVRDVNINGIGSFENTLTGGIVVYTELDTVSISKVNVTNSKSRAVLFGVVNLPSLTKGVVVDNSKTISFSEINVVGCSVDKKALLFVGVGCHGNGSISHCKVTDNSMTANANTVVNTTLMGIALIDAGRVVVEDNLATRNSSDGDYLVGLGRLNFLGVTTIPNVNFGAVFRRNVSSYNTGTGLVVAGFGLPQVLKGTVVSARADVYSDNIAANNLITGAGYSVGFLLSEQLTTTYERNIAKANQYGFRNLGTILPSNNIVKYNQADNNSVAGFSDPVFGSNNVYMSNRSELNTLNYAGAYLLTMPIVVWSLAGVAPPLDNLQNLSVTV